MASRYQYRYAYESQIPKMMSLLNPTAPTPNNVRELYKLANDKQRDLWRVSKRVDGAIRQYHLEKEVWTTYFGQASGEFPGVFPEMISPPSSEHGKGSTNVARSSQLSQSESSSLAAQFISAPVADRRSSEREGAYGVQVYVPISFEEAGPITQRHTKHASPPIELKSNTEVEVERLIKEVQQEVQLNIHGLPKKPKTPQGHLVMLPSASTRRDIRAEIERRKGKGYQPAYGWELDMPRYVIICDKSRNAAEKFGGSGARYLIKVQAAFPSIAINWQCIRPGFMVIWIEGIGEYNTTQLNADRKLWEKFKNCYAFLKTWADNGNKNGHSMNIVEYLEIWQTSELEGDKDEMALLSPPHLP
ncbi:hypothetical protein BDZ45DRAFT_741738 [Acephala macrosclerotiorum]|nr:hypothetical protein BDZ45DRAFT_741738 [Acephala macrosclerotiorum]